MNIWEKFDKAIDVEEMAKEVKEADSSASGDYKEVPHGQYEVKVDFMELRASKKGDPMITIWFKVISGEYKNSLIFMNQVLNLPFQCSIANNILRNLHPDKTVEFESYSQYGNLIADIYEEIDGKYEYALEYSDHNGYPKFEIIDVFQ